MSMPDLKGLNSTWYNCACFACSFSTVLNNILIVLDYFDSKLSFATTPLEAAAKTISFTKDFWEAADLLGDRVQKYTVELIHNAAGSNATVAAKLGDFKNTMLELVSSVNALRGTVQRAVKEHDALQDVSEKLSIELEAVLEELKRKFPSPDKATHHEERVEMISWVLSRIEDILVRVLNGFGVSEADTRAHFQVIARHIKLLLILVGEEIRYASVFAAELMIDGRSTRR